MPIIDYRPMCVITLAPWEVEEILEAAITGGEVEAGHGAYLVRVGMYKKNIININLNNNECKMNVKVELNRLQDLRGERRIVVVSPIGVGVAEIRDRHYYKLVPTVPGSYPTLEIDGIHMHRVRGVDPATDTRFKIIAARIRRGVEVLDTCMGLGYTAIGSIVRGAKRVVTVEIDRNVIKLSRINPWSWKLADKRITVVHDDVTSYIRTLEDESFDRIIHDPPRITKRSGPLYSLSFYKELHRVLRPRGVLFHYTGEPGRKHGANFPGRVSSKLKEAGFRVLRFSRRAQGVIAVKE